MVQRIRAGVVAGLAGGMVFGMMMAMMGMLPMIAGMVGSTSAIVGFGVHLVISAMIGVGYTLLLSPLATSTARGVITGVVYGMAWWIIGPLTMMPLMMGMGFGTQWNATAMGAALPSLMGHMIYGAIVGFVARRLLHAHGATETRRTA